MATLPELSPLPGEDTLEVEQMSHDLFKLSLTKQNKPGLFSEAIDRLDSAREEADLIMRNLQAWAPDAAARFHRRTSDVILDTPFRLIYSSPTRDPFDGDFVVRQFLAISYSWHNSEWPGTPSSAPEPGGVWPIGKRFAAGILAQRGHWREGVWMDQICINQRDEDEKQRAIACMDIIYKSCRKLVVLLEDVDLTEDEAALCGRYDGYKSPFKFEKPPQDEDEIALLVSVYDKVAAARWWQRAWCFHEFVVGEPWSNKRHHQVHNTVFIVGLGGDRTFAIEWLTLHSILVIVTAQLRHQTPYSAQVNPILSGFGNRTSPLLDGPGGKAGVAKASFMARFNAVAQTGCFMPGDKLSVCINLIGLGLAYFRSEEPTPDEVYYLAVLLAIAAGEKVPLSFTNMESLAVGGKPSWLARPVTAADMTLGKFTLGGIRGIHRVSAGRLEIDLVFFENNFTGHTESELQETYAIFPGVIKSTPPPLKASMSQAPQFRPDEDMDMDRRRFLAAVVSGGPGLVRRLWAQLDREVVQQNYNSTRVFADFVANDDLRPNAAELMAALAKNGPEGADDGHGITSEVALAFVTWITDPRSIYWISALTARIPCTRDGEQALLTGFMLTNHFRASGDVRVAIPKDLLQGDCAWLRAWILAPAGDEEGDAAWRVVGKTMLLGEPDLEEEMRRAEDDGQSDAVVALRTRQVILG